MSFQYFESSPRAPPVREEHLWEWSGMAWPPVDAGMMRCGGVDGSVEQDCAKIAISNVAGIRSSKRWMRSDKDQVPAGLGMIEPTQFKHH